MLTDSELMTGIAEALNAREVTTPNARGIARNLCPCGSKQIGYNLFDHTGKLLMYCCFACEKERRC
jgi:hypothetical protein